MSAVRKAISISRRALIFSFCMLLLTNLKTGAAEEQIARIDAEVASAFKSQTIDIGVVVNDVDVALKFYTEAVGMTEVPGFSVSRQIAAGAGLTEDSPMNIKIVKLGKAKTATALKLIEVVGSTPKTTPNNFIETQTGVSYITLLVTDMDQSVVKLKAAGVEILASGPQELVGKAPGVFITLVRDPDGNFVELVGPGKVKSAEKSGSKE